MNTIPIMSDCSKNQDLSDSIPQISIIGSSCDICAFQHNTSEHRCSIHYKLYGNLSSTLPECHGHGALNCPLKICQFCNIPKGHINAHNTNKHLCTNCKSLGLHASNKCPICHNCLLRGHYTYSCNAICRFCGSSKHIILQCDKVPL